MSGQRPTQVNATMPSGETGLERNRNSAAAVPSGSTVLSGVRARARALLAGAPADGDGSVRLSEAECRSLLAGIVPFGPAIRRGGRRRGPGRRPGRSKYPVVCKLLDPAVLHKTELGLVRRAVIG